MGVSLSSNDVSHRYHRMLRESWDYLTPQRTRTDKAWDFYDGNQWTKEEIQELSDRHQQPSVLNIVSPLVRAFRAIEKNRQTDYVVLGREESDDKIAEILTVLLNQTFKNSNFNHFLSEVARDGAISGIGWFEIAPELDIDTKDTIIKMFMRPWEEMFYDPYARRPDLTDARYIIRQIWMDRDEAIERWPAKKEELEGEFDDATFEHFHGLEEEAQFRTSNSFYMDNTKNSRRISINDTYYKDAENKVRHLVFTGNIFLKGSLEGKNPSPYKSNIYPFIPFIADRDKKGRPVGIIEPLIPIQETLNKTLSKWLWNVSSQRVLFELDAFADPEAAKAEIAKPDAWIPLNPGTIKDGKIEIGRALDESAHLMQMINLLVEMSGRITGINDALIGIGGNNARTAVQEGSRIQQGASLQTAVIENLYFSKLQAAKVTLNMIGQHYTKEMILRIVAPDGTTEEFRLNARDDQGNPFNDISDILAYDVELREELPFTIAREATNRLLSEIIKSIPESARVLMIPFIKNLPIQNKDFLIQKLEAAFETKEADQRQAGINEQLQSAGLSPQVN
jgi:hypothetical protein